MAAFVGVERMLHSVIFGLIKPMLRSNSTVRHSLHLQQTETLMTWFSLQMQFVHIK